MLGGVLAAILYEYVFKMQEVNANIHHEEISSSHEGVELKTQI